MNLFNFKKGEETKKVEKKPNRNPRNITLGEFLKLTQVDNVALYNSKEAIITEKAEFSDLMMYYNARINLVTFETVDDGVKLHIYLRK